MAKVLNFIAAEFPLVLGFGRRDPAAFIDEYPLFRTIRCSRMVMLARYGSIIDHHAIGEGFQNLFRKEARGWTTYWGSSPLPCILEVL